MAEPRAIRRVLIVGGGTAGWMTASALATLLPHLEVTLVESDAIQSVGVGEATIPPINLFNRMLGLNDADLLNQAQASYKLGIEFVGWRRPDERYLHPFGAFGQPLGAVDFHQLWLRARAEGDATPIDAYNIAAQACLARRCARPAHHAPRSPLSGLFTAWHFDAILYARFLRRVAEARGVSRVEGKVVGAEHDERGDVARVVVEDGCALTADLFIDCTGFRALLIGGARAVPFRDWSHLLPNDRAAALQSSRIEPPLPFTRATARPAGWTWRIPLQHRTGNGYVFSSAHLGEQAALDAIVAMADGEPVDDPRILRFRAGHRERMWDGNVVAIGLAAGFLEPLESTSIHLIQQGISRFVKLLPHTLPAPASAAEFNRAMNREYESIRDFLLLHYWANARDEPYWRDRRAIALPDTLAHRLALWREQGIIVREEHELFAEASWIAVLLGQGISAAGYAPIADTIPAEAASRHLAAIRDAVARATAAMPAHGDFIARQRAQAGGVAAELSGG